MPKCQHCFLWICRSSRSSANPDQGIHEITAVTGSATIQDVWRLSTSITLARVEAVQGGSAQATVKLRTALNEADKFRTIPLQLEIRRALCELDRQDCADVKRDARDRGFILIANRVVSLLASHKRPITANERWK